MRCEGGLSIERKSQHKRVSGRRVRFLQKLKLYSKPGLFPRRHSRPRRQLAGCKISLVCALLPVHPTALYDEHQQARRNQGIQGRYGGALP